MNKIVGLMISAAFLSMSACIEQPSRVNKPAADAPKPEVSALSKLKDNKFVVTDKVMRQDMALKLVNSLSDPNPKIRDGIAYEALYTWMRSDQLDQSTIIALKQSLLAKVRGSDESKDRGGFGKPFAALVLAEVARVDRIKPFMSDAERSEFVDAAVTYVRNITDYRGFDDKQGWRHNVAHGADWLMQLSLNDRVGIGDLVAIRNAVGVQVRADGEHAYIHGEPARLARPILFMARRGAFTEAEWTAWVTALADPTPLGSWSDAFSSEHGLAKRHNVKAFLSAVYLNASLSKDPVTRRLLPGVTEALRKLP